MQRLTRQPNGAFRFTPEYLAHCGGPIAAVEAPAAAPLRPTFDLDDLRASGRWVTVYLGERPVATLERRAVYAPKSEPVWRLFLTDGREIGQLHALPPSRRWVAARLDAEGVR